MAPIASAFGLPLQSAEALGQGLIHHSYQITVSGGEQFLLQQLNTQVFAQPQIVQENFVAIRRALQGHYALPHLVPTGQGQLYLQHQQQAWRCFTWVPHSYAPTGSISPELAYDTARCFGSYARLLSQAMPSLHTVLPRFHHLGWRAQQLKAACQQATAQRLQAARPVLSLLDAHTDLLRQYEYWQQSPQPFPLRILHHDCKPSNILFHQQTGQLLCPVDLDTTQPGLFFSDLGDMVRSMVPNLPEDHAAVADLALRPLYWQALQEGYADGSQPLWTPDVRAALPLAGVVLLYMQAMRFLADYLQGDVYYHTSYPGQNLDRAANQAHLLRPLRQLATTKS